MLRSSDMAYLGIGLNSTHWKFVSIITSQIRIHFLGDGVWGAVGQGMFGTHQGCKTEGRSCLWCHWLCLALFGLLSFQNQIFCLNSSRDILLNRMEPKLLGVAFKALHHLVPPHFFSLFSHHIPSPFPSREFCAVPCILHACACLHAFALLFLLPMACQQRSPLNDSSPVLECCWISSSTARTLPNGPCKERIFAASGFATDHTNKSRNIKWKHWELGHWVGPQSIVEKPKLVRRNEYPCGMENLVLLHN